MEAVLREYGLWRSHIPFLGDLAEMGRAYRRPGAFLVVTAGGRVVGCGGLSPSTAKKASLQRMYLLKPYRGRGLGRRVLDRLLARARASKLRFVTLETAPRLKDAVALYERSGFRRIKSLATDCCSVKMRLSLPG